MTTDDQTGSGSGSDSSAPQPSDDTTSDNTSSDSSSDSTDGASSDSSSDSTDGASSDSSSATQDPEFVPSEDIVVGSVDAAPSSAGAAAASAGDPSQQGVAADAESGGGGGTASELVNLGLAVFKVMDDGTPNMVPVDQMASGVPSGVSALSDMSNFSSDDRKLQLHHHASTIGSDHLPFMDPTELTITVLWRYGGQYKGTGHYVAMANVSVTGQPGTGRHIDVTASFDKPINVGSGSDPIADLGLNIVLSSTGAFHTNQYVRNFRGSLKGNGAGLLEVIS